jgi:flagellar basal body-associated protein FliL
MAFLNLAVLLLSGMVLVLAVMVGYMYWQQSKVLQAVGALNGMLMVQNTAPPVEEEEEDEEEEDDRVSVQEESEIEVVQGPPPPAVEEDEDDVHNKTAPQLRDLLTKKGIPFGKRDSKNVLLQLVKATA